MTTERPHRYLITYDIASDTRRIRLATMLESYGDRLQYSVFIVDAKPAKIIKLKATARTHMNLTVDSLLIADLGPLNPTGSSLEFIGPKRHYTDQGPPVF